MFVSKLGHKIPSQDQSSPAFVDIKFLIRGVQSEHIVSIRGEHIHPSNAHIIIKLL